jgi:hypothetical protein
MGFHGRRMMGLLMASNIIWSLLGHSVGYYPLVGEILDTAVVGFAQRIRMQTQIRRGLGAQA